MKCSLAELEPCSQHYSGKYNKCRCFNAGHGSLLKGLIRLGQCKSCAERISPEERLLSVQRIIFMILWCNICPKQDALPLTTSKTVKKSHYLRLEEQMDVQCMKKAPSDFKELHYAFDVTFAHSHTHLDPGSREYHQSSPSLLGNGTIYTTRS